jgi:hypothetical protein
MFLKYISQDRRRRKRQLLNSSVRVCTDTGWIDAIGVNISEVGMSLFTIANLPIDSQIQIELVPPGSPELTRISGTVRHRALYLYGIEFGSEATGHPAVSAPGNYLSSADGP